MSNITFSVFTKPWQTESIDELGEFISGLGFEGIEFPLRSGYQVEPKDAEKGLPKLVDKLGNHGVKVTSVASVTDEKVFAGCAEAGIPVIRIMASCGLGKNYMEWEKEKKKELENIIPLCEKYGVKVGIQHHYGPMVSNSMELLHLIEDFNSEYIGAIWDSAHTALAGEEPEQGLDIVWSHLCMVNLKNAFYRRINGPEADEAKWDRYFTTGWQGLASWSRVAAYLKERDYNGVVCLTAEYTAEEEVNKLIKKDIEYAKSLFE